MKVKVSIINKRCITMSEAVTMPSLTMVTLTVSDKSLAKDRQTDTDTDTQSDMLACIQTDSQTDRQRQTGVSFRLCKQKPHTGIRKQ